MKAVLLCGGVGKRMFPITEDKLLLNFLGKPLLSHQIAKLKEAGLRELVVVVSPQNAYIIERIANEVTGIRTKFVVQEKALGIANALETAEPFLKGEVVIVNPNDTFETSALTSLIRSSRKAGADAYVIGYKVKDYFPGGYLVTNQRNELKRIVEKPARGDEPSNLVNILLHLHTEAADLMKYVARAQTSRDDVYECALDLMVSEGHKIRIVPYSGFWKAIKYPWHIFGVVRYFLDGSRPSISPSAQISPKAIVEGNVIIEDKVKVLENAVIRGPAYIGAQSIIGNNVLIRDYSHIGRNCVVGYCTEVKGSYIGDNCWFHSSYVGDSVIDDNCSLAAGTVLANFRFDEKNIKVKIGGESIDTGLDKFGAIMGGDSKTGINASIMPGVRIGPRSFVGSHVCLMKDLPPDRMVLMEPRYRMLDSNITLGDKMKTSLMKKLEKL
ncbi:MAG: NTP transferase domain-containing protein [Dehalococcoidia bacterium]|nr:NTP transferase domain-containing protein [Dehalococcoidia bacterium]